MDTSAFKESDAYIFRVEGCKWTRFLKIVMSVYQSTWHYTVYSLLKFQVLWDVVCHVELQVVTSVFGSSMFVSNVSFCLPDDMM
jgi:hypothetical protein